MRTITIEVNENDDITMQTNMPYYESYGLLITVANNLMQEMQFEHHIHRLSNDQEVKKLVKEVINEVWEEEANEKDKPTSSE